MSVAEVLIIAEADKKKLDWFIVERPLGAFPLLYRIVNDSIT